MYTLKIINGKRIWVSDTLTHIDPSERAQGHIGRKLQGGDPPVPYRNACSKWATCPTKWAREPFASRQIRGEVLADRRAMQ